MTARPIVPESRKKPISKAFALCIVLVAAVLAAGCTTGPSPDNQTASLTPAPVSPTIEKSLMFYGVKIPQAEAVNPDFVRMGADIYNQGEVIEFYVENGGSEDLMCWHTFPPYNLYRQTGTWELIIKPTGTQIGWGSGLKPGESTPVRQLNTADLTPGHYKLVTDCGVSREFEVRVISGVTAS